MAELHVHLRGTITPTMLARLAKRHGLKIDVPASSATYVWDTFAGFLAAYHKVAAAIKTAEDYCDLTIDYLERSAADGVLYCEIMVAPDHAADVGVSYRSLIEAIDEGITRTKHLGIESRIIVTCVRHRGPEAAERLMKEVSAFPHKSVVAFGMAGDEKKYRPRDFSNAFAAAEGAGLFRTCHVGEFQGPDSIWEALTELRLDRLGHGVRCIEDAGLVQQLSERGTCLEICPTSNFRLGLYTTETAHPIRALYDAGCVVTLNSDDPAHFDGSLKQEYMDAAQNFGLSDQDLAQITRNAINAAFCDDETKARLRRLLY